MLKTMRNVARWFIFTVATALVGLGLAFGLLVLGRLYVGMQAPAFVLGALVTYCVGVSLAAFSYAWMLDEARDVKIAACRRREPEFDA